MKKTSIISIVLVSAFTFSAVRAFTPKPLSKTKFTGHKSSVVRNVLIASSIRQAAMRSSRSNSGGGSSYGK